MSLENSRFVFDSIKTRHWCPRSEKYTGVDSLLELLRQGWVLNKRVLYHEVWHSTRPSIVYYFELKRNHEIVTMAVINSPLIRSILKQYDLQVITENDYAPAHV